MFAAFRIFRLVSYLYGEINDFAEAVRSNDFTRKFPPGKIRKNILYKHFNDINDAFIAFGKEKETQAHHLKAILEMVNTGILVYDRETSEVVWMNNALANIFLIPQLKNIGWLEKRNPDLYDQITSIPVGETKLTTIVSGKQVIKIVANASLLQTDEKVYKLIAFHHIGHALEEIESGAWKGLLNVMTHEIMNSIAPISSLAESLQKRVFQMKEDDEMQRLPDFEEVEFALETIHKRSDGLLRFSETYRNLNQKMEPELRPVNLFELLQAVRQLMHPSLLQKGIALETKTDHPSVVARIDANLIEQAIINFITNATYALKKKAATDPEIVLFSGITAEHKPYITVADNGCGIPDEIRDKLFIPFFSTKKQGNGIGLSISREIIKLHRGTIIVQSEEGKGSAFTLLFERYSD